MTTAFYYNLTNLTQENATIGDVLKFTNEITNNIFWIATIPVVWIIMFGTLASRFGGMYAFVSSLFITAMYTYIIAALGLIPLTITLLMTIALVTGILVMALPKTSL